MTTPFRILFVHPIFGPNEAIAEKNINSIVSIGNYLRENRISNVDMVFGGWCREAAHMDKIKATIRRYFPYAEIQEWDKNVGKGTVVNTLSKKLNDSHKFMLTADSDILFPLDTADMFDRLIIMAQVSEQLKKRPFGMIGLNQLGAGCHMDVCQENFVTYDVEHNGKKYAERMVWPTGGGGIAGGCLFISKAAWQLIGGYKIQGVYSGDDAYFLLDCYMRGFTYQMSESIAIVHPPENDLEYAQWKVKVCQRDSGRVQSNLDPFIDEANEFWDSKCKKST